VNPQALAQVPPRAEVPDRAPTLDELAETIRAEHAVCMDAVESALGHAVKAGEALLSARELLLPDGTWVPWLEANFPRAKSTAYSYMRLATYQHLIPDGVGITAGDRLVQGLSALDGGPGRARVSLVTKEEAERLRSDGASYKQIAKTLGASPATVHYWFNGSKRSRQNKNAREALRQQERDKALKKAVCKTGGALAEAYAMAERLDDVLGQAHREATEKEARRDLARAHEFQRAMRDMIVRSLGVEK
jgi:predicted transcriptional regulator